MNKIKAVILAVLSTFVFLSATAQTYKIDTSSISYENRLRPCYWVKVDPRPKDLKKAWAKYLKKSYNVKLKGISWFSNKDMLYGKDVTIAKISSKRMDIYTRITENANGSDMKFMGAFGYDFFIGPEKFPAEFAAMRDILNNFLLEELNNYYTSELKSIEKQNEKLEKNITSLEKDVLKNQKKIGKNEGSIKGGSDKSAKLKTENNKLEDKITNARLIVQKKKSQIEVNNTKATEMRQKQQGLLNI